MDIHGFERLPILRCHFFLLSKKREYSNFRERCFRRDWMFRTSNRPIYSPHLSQDEQTTVLTNVHWTPCHHSYPYQLHTERAGRIFLRFQRLYAAHHWTPDPPDAKPLEFWPPWAELSHWWSPAISVEMSFSTNSIGHSSTPAQALGWRASRQKASAGTRARPQAGSASTQRERQEFWIWSV